MILFVQSSTTYSHYNMVVRIIANSPSKCNNAGIQRKLSPDITVIYSNIFLLKSYCFSLYISMWSGIISLVNAFNQPIGGSGFYSDR